MIPENLVNNATAVETLNKSLVGNPYPASPVVSVERKKLIGGACHPLTCVACSIFVFQDVNKYTRK